MKIKTIIIAILFWGIVGNVYSQEYVDFTPQWPEKHVVLYQECPIAVARLNNWAPDYLTVIDNYWNWLFHNAPTTLGVFCVITEVNGQSTKGMSPQTFYNIMYDNTRITLKYLRKENGKNVHYNETITKPKGCGLVETWARDMDNRQWVLTDEDVDFFKFNTYDFVINEDENPLEQKQLLKVFANELEGRGLKRSTDNPDLYLYVTMNSNENIESVYQPRTITTTNSDTYGNSNVYAYSRDNRKYADVRTNSNTSTRTTTTDVGTMRTYVSADVYIELTILDAKRTSQSTAPRVWQFKYEGRIDGSISLNKYEGWLVQSAKIYPFGNNSKYKPKTRTGRDDNHKNYFYGVYVYNGEISYIHPNSFAAKQGVKVGDKLELSSGRVKGNSVLLKVKNGFLVLKEIGQVKLKTSMMEPSYTIENAFIANW